MLIYVIFNDSLVGVGVWGLGGGCGWLGGRWGNSQVQKGLCSSLDLKVMIFLKFDNFHQIFEKRAVAVSVFEKPYF